MDGHGLKMRPGRRTVRQTRLLSPLQGTQTLPVADVKRQTNPTLCGTARKKIARGETKMEMIYVHQLIS